MSLIKSIIAFCLSIISGLLGFLGISGLCCTLAGGAILSFLGLASLSTFLVYHNIWFFIVAFVFLVLAILALREYKKNNVCPYCQVKNNKQKK